jgi:cyclopropane-fatty-acyl-phospholipid synthase
MLSGSWVLGLHLVRARLFNRQAARAFEVGERHYDVGNDLYEAMLGRRMVYTCAYWKNADTLDAAQEAKLDLVCRKIGLRPGARVLDLGCGWAGFASFAAENYGANVVGYTVSREQVAWAKQHYAHLPIDIRLDDYRNASGRYDAVVSIGLMEHVGHKNHRDYMKQAVRCLVPGGIAFIHTIGGNGARTEINPWFDKYVFPNAAIPSLGQLTTAMEDILVPEDIQNIGPHYDRTLMAWWQNFDAAWPRLRERYGDRFYRTWKFYLQVCAAYFRTRQHNLYQIVATPAGAPQPSMVRCS